MADINLSPYTAEQQAMDRRRKMAEALQQQAIAPIEMPNVPGARVSPYQGLAKLLQGYIAGKNLERADQEQKAYEISSQEDVARLLRNVGKTETIPGDIITPGKPFEAINENVTKVFETRVQPESFTAEERNAAMDLPLKTEAVAPEYGPSRQVPYLSADLLDPNNPLAMKTGQGKQMLAQYLMQQEAQKQATALRKQEAEQAIVKFGPEDTAGRIVDGRFVPIVQGVKQPKWEKSSQFDESGRETTGWVNTNAPNIPASFVKGSVKPEMTASQRLEAELRLYGTEIEADKAIDVNRPARTFERLPKGVPVGAKKVGTDKATGKDVYKLNNELFVGE